VTRSVSRTLRLVYLTGSRADYAPMRPVLRKLAAERWVDLSVLVTGMHLLPRFGRTDRLMAERLEHREIAPGPATEVQDAKRRLAFDMTQQGLDVLAHVVIARALPERGGASLVIGERLRGDRGQRGSVELRAWRHADCP